jgi:hypothetical protein
MLKIIRKKTGIGFVLLSFVVFVYLILILNNQNDERKSLKCFNTKNLFAMESNVVAKKKLALIVPYRDCLTELKDFVPHLTKFLNTKEIPHHIFVINQTDEFRFNRASLINIGFLYVKDIYEYFIMHDVDLLPLNLNLDYDYPKEKVLQISPYRLHPVTHVSKPTEKVFIIHYR